MCNWLVVGISGLSGGGKTTLAKAVHKTLNNKEEYPQILECHLLHQDDYFFPQDYKNHLWMPELKHVNWDVMGALDMDKMVDDINNITKKALKRDWTTAIKAYRDIPSHVTAGKNKIRDRNMKINVLIIEGFLILNHAIVREKCDVKYYLDLTKEQCYDRRKDRVYDPPDVPGYFDKAVWAGHLKNKSEILKYDVEFLDGLRNDLHDHITNLVHFLLGYDS